MTREQIEAMPAGPEMDALVAERVMGWWADANGEWNSNPDLPKLMGVVAPDTSFCDLPVWQPSSDIAAAWEVVEKLSDKLWCELKVNFTSDYKSRAGFTTVGCSGFNGRPDFAACGNTRTDLPLAICRAALLATLNA